VPMDPVSTYGGIPPYDRFSDLRVLANQSTNEEAWRRGHDAAALIADERPEALLIEDPRDPDFARGVLDGLTRALQSAPGVMRRLVSGAAASAEDLNIEAFHGIVEVIQNADDLGAGEIRLALSEEDGLRRLYIVHTGSPVTCHHVLAMSLPYVSTKSESAEQKGRFGIGLKTLKRIASRISIHSAPYHFTAEGLEISEVAPAASVGEFYSPVTDTLLVLDLLDDFEPDAFANWFDAWDAENLLFLQTVQKFSRFDFASGTVASHSVQTDNWNAITSEQDFGAALERRAVNTSQGRWTIYRARVSPPAGLKRSHKATGETTSISIAVPEQSRGCGLYIGFKTRIPVQMPFNIDAQFDPSTAREGLIENPWNKWLIRQCGTVAGAIARHLLATAPPLAWRLIPAVAEHIGLPEQPWPQPAFAESFASLRATVGSGTILIGGEQVPLVSVAFESSELEGLLGGDELRLLATEATPLGNSQRDENGRWRRALGDVGTATEIGIDALRKGFAENRFGKLGLDWWIDAADRLTKHAPGEALFGLPCWRNDRNAPIAIARRGATARRLLIGEPLSDFAARWRLFDRLHEEYSASESGKRTIAWLHAQAAVASIVDPADELEAFAETWAAEPIAVTETELRDLRDRFDLLSDRRAAPLGLKVGAALLLDGFAFKGGKKVPVTTTAGAAYLPKTIDKERPYWPEAAAGLPDIIWLSSSYEDRLKTGATRTLRKREDGIISRGARKFLILLGAATGPRIVSTGKRVNGSEWRRKQLAERGAEYVKVDFVAPDLERVLAALKRMSKKERRPRSAMLLKALSRHWPDYAQYRMTQAIHMAVKYEYERGQIEADWLCRLRDSEWVAIGTGDLTRPQYAVIRSQATATIYGPKSFVAGIGPEDLREDFASALQLITEVRASDLLRLIEQLRDNTEAFSLERFLQACRSLAKMCPSPLGWNSRIGDLTLSDLRTRFAAKNGLVFIPAADGVTGKWRRPAELLTGRDIFRKPERFAPGGSACSALWVALQIRRPGLDDCIVELRELAGRPYRAESEAVLMDVYRYIEPLIARADRRQKDRLRALPVGTATGWSSTRPIYRVDDRELREQLFASRPDFRFWQPPCDTQTLPHVCAALGLTKIDPIITVREDATALLEGEGQAARFERCVDHLANELARNDPATRDKIALAWNDLRKIRLEVHEAPFEVMVHEERLSSRPLPIQMHAVLERDPWSLNVTRAALPRRDRCGRAIASLFPGELRHKIEAEWTASWIASEDTPVERIKLASDEELARALAAQAAAARAAIQQGNKIKVTPPASRAPKAAPPRRLKGGHGGISSVEIVKGEPPKPAPPRTGLQTPVPPPWTTPSPPAPSGSVEYDTRDLEQRGWEILHQVLLQSTDQEIIDFRKHHRIGADGLADGKRFIELKATGTGAQSAVELSASEFERAQEQGLNFMLALVSGLEEGYRTEVRLILDPANRTSIRPVGSIRLVGLKDAPAVVHIIGDDDAPAASPG